MAMLDRLHRPMPPPPPTFPGSRFDRNFSGIRALTAVSRNAKGVNGVLCRYKGVNGILLQVLAALMTFTPLYRKNNGVFPKKVEPRVTSNDFSNLSSSPTAWLGYTLQTQKIVKLMPCKIPRYVSPDFRLKYKI